MIDAGQAYRFARGAMWHLEVALPLLDAASTGAGRATDLVASAATHVDSAFGDLAKAAANVPGTAGVDDAVLAAKLTAAAREARDGTGTPSALRDIVASARSRVQQSIDAIAPQLSTREELLPLAPAPTTHNTDLALIDRVEDARRFRQVSDVQRDVYRRVLSEGTIDPNPVAWVGGYGNGNGAMPLVRVQHPDTPHLSLLAVHRPPTAQAAQEDFFAQLAEHAGVDHAFAPVERRPDGSALVLAVPGGASWEQGIDSGEDIADTMATWYRQRFPSLAPDDARLAGQLDFDEARSLDYIVANPDRNAGGLLADRSAGILHYIDNGFAGRGETHDVLKPGLKSHFVGGAAGHAELHPRAATAIATRLDDAHIADAHAVLGRGPDGDLPGGHALALGQDASQGFLDAMRARRDQVATGAFDYEPIDLNANPLAHMDWLQGGRRPY